MEVEGKQHEARFQKRVIELVDVDAPDTWNDLKYGILEAFDKVCGKVKVEGTMGIRGGGIKR